MKTLKAEIRTFESTDIHGKDISTVVVEGEHYINVELSAYGRVLGEFEVHVQTAGEEAENMYRVDWIPRKYDTAEKNAENVDPFIVEEGHKVKGILQSV